MLKLLFLTLIFISTLYANKVIYLSYDEIPKRVIKGEIFTVTLKALSTVRDFDDIEYEFLNYSGLKILDERPEREEKGKFFYDTFHILATASYAKLPDVNATLVASREYNSTFIDGPELNIITLNPKKNFSNIIADELTLVEYKTTTYDKSHNIVVFIAQAKNSDISAMHFKNVYKQGSESKVESYNDSKITYFVVIDKRIENFTFSYFNLKKNNFAMLNIPIIVDDDSVTTQSDLKPRDQSHDKIKMYAAAAVAFIAFFLIVWRKKYIYLIFILIPLVYIISLATPEETICIKEGAQIRLLPVDNGTIFETTQTKYYLPKEGSVKNFIKVQLQNEKIGWVKNEDTCSY
ncbi:hypothetical protein [Sulfurimonas sp.]